MQIKKIHVITIILLGVVVIGGGYLWANWGVEERVVSGDGVKVAENGKYADKEGNNDVGEIDTPNWRVYRNEEYDYNIKFDPSWILHGDSKNAVYFLDFLAKNDPENKQSEDLDRGNKIQILVEKNKASLTLEDWYRKNINAEENNYHSIIINGIRGLRWETPQGNPSSILSKGENIYILTLISRDSLDEAKIIYEKMINSFE